MTTNLALEEASMTAFHVLSTAFTTAWLFLLFSFVPLKAFVSFLYLDADSFRDRCCGTGASIFDFAFSGLFCVRARVRGCS